MKRRRVVVFGLLFWASSASSFCVVAPAPAAAQLDATPLELDLIDAWVDLQVALSRGEPALVSERRRHFEEARTALIAAMGRGAHVDLERVQAAVAARLADVEGRLAEMGRTCGPVPDSTPARARRDALLEVRAEASRGVFVPAA